MHARDVVERLIDAKVSAPGDFEWVSQLRYYWLDSASSLGDENMIVRMVQVGGERSHLQAAAYQIPVGIASFAAGVVMATQYVNQYAVALD